MLLPIVRWTHLLAAAVWTGGLLTLGALVPALRQAGADRAMLQAAARRFGVVSWTAMGVAIATGVLQVHLMHLPWAFGKLHIKLGMVGLTVAITLYHQVTARSSSPRARGMVQGLILLCSLGIFAAAVHLGGT